MANSYWFLWHLLLPTIWWFFNIQVCKLPANQIYITCYDVMLVQGCKPIPSLETFRRPFIQKSKFWIPLARYSAWIIYELCFIYVHLSTWHYNFMYLNRPIITTGRMTMVYVVLALEYFFILPTTIIFIQLTINGQTFLKLANIVSVEVSMLILY